jgi:hypothetical protein
VQVDVLAHEVAQRVGASGFAFSLDGAEGAPLADLAGDGELPAALSIDYSTVGCGHRYVYLVGKS